MSDTPRTDAQKRGDFVHINFARELERENAALREELKEANRLLHIWSPESAAARKEAQP